MQRVQQGRQHAGQKHRPAVVASQHVPCPPTACTLPRFRRQRTGSHQTHHQRHPRRHRGVRENAPRKVARLGGKQGGGEPPHLQPRAKRQGRRASGQGRTDAPAPAPVGRRWQLGYDFWASSVVSVRRPTQTNHLPGVTEEERSRHGVHHPPHWQPRTQQGRRASGQGEGGGRNRREAVAAQ